MHNKKYHQQYYKKNRERIKKYQRERYAQQKGLRNIASAVNPSQSGSTGFFTITSERNGNKVRASEIMSQFQGWIFTCATVNGSSTASQTLRLYATVEDGANNKFLHKNLPVSKHKYEWMREESTVKSLARVRKADNIVEIVDHPLLDLLENVNNFNNNFESFELTQIYLDMIGDSYWYIVKNELGMPEAIWVLQSQHMKILPAAGTKKFIKGYVYGQEGDFGQTDGLIKFRPDEIVHFRTPNPNSLYYGRGAAQSVISAITRMNAMDVSEQARLDNQGRPDFVVSYKNGKLDSSEIKKIERMWNRAFGGPGKAGKIKVMDEDFSLETLGFSPKDMEYLSGRVWSLKEISGAFNIPYSILDTSDTKKATSELAEYWYSKNAILPRITRIQEKLNEKLVPLYDPSGRMFLLYDDPVPENRELVLKENTEYVKNGIMSVNEVRLKMGLAALGEEFDMPKPNNTPSLPPAPEQPEVDDEDQ